MSKNYNIVYFLFINGPHHVYHLIEPALRFASNNHEYHTVFVSGNPRNTLIINNAHQSNPNAEFTLLDIPLPLRYKLIKSYKGKIYPPVHTRINKIASKLEKALAIVSTSHELPQYLHERNINRPKLFYLYHGTGTRAYGFEKNLSRFDHILIPGPYHKRRLIQEKVCEEHKLGLVGQPKFDWIAKHKKEYKTLFNNNNPIFYYSPHWELNISSYLKWRKLILKFFESNSNYNLIFAPHPLVKHFSKKEKYNIESSKLEFENIIIDFDSDKLIDGTYNSIADVYIGDVSSIFTEWLYDKPRPCIFINAHKVDWVDQENYYMWKYGEVVESKKDFIKAIENSLKANRYFEKQTKYVDDLIFNGEKPPSDLCADYILKKIQSAE